MVGLRVRVLWDRRNHYIFCSLYCSRIRVKFLLEMVAKNGVWAAVCLCWAYRTQTNAEIDMNPPSLSRRFGKTGSKMKLSQH